MKKQVKFIITGDNRGAVDAINGVDKSAKNLTVGMGDLSKVMYSTFGPLLAGMGIVEIARQLTDAAIASQKMTNAMLASTGSSARAADELAFVRAEAERLGLDLLTSADAYTKLTAAAKGTTLEGQATRDIFTAVSGAATSLGLKADDTEGALRAIQQMMSKGTVQAEELRGQLGERLPGAFNVAARAMGVSTAELGKMLEQGQVISDDFLPKFAAELKKTFEPTPEMLKSTTAEMNRLTTSIYDLKVSVMEGGGSSMLGDLTSWSTTFVATMRDNIGYLEKFKMSWVQLGIEMGIVMEGGNFGSNWLTSSGRDVIEERLAASRAMYDKNYQIMGARFGHNPLPREQVPADSWLLRDRGLAALPKNPPPAKDKKTPTNKYDAAAVDKQMWIDEQEARNTVFAEGLIYRRDAEADARAQNLQAQYDHDAVMKEMELDRINGSVDAYIAGEQRKRENAYISLQQEQQLNSAKMQMTGQFLDAMNTMTGNKNKVIFAAQKLFSIGVATMSAFQASALALAQPPGPPATIPLSKLAFKIGMMNVAGIAATSIASLSGGGGGGGGGGYGGGTPSSPIVTQPAASSVSSGQAITVQIMGNVIGEDKWVEEKLVPALRDLQSRNVTLQVD